METRAITPLPPTPSQVVSTADTTYFMGQQPAPAISEGKFICTEQ